MRFAGRTVVESAMSDGEIQIDEFIRVHRVRLESMNCAGVEQFGLLSVIEFAERATDETVSVSHLMLDDSSCLRVVVFRRSETVMTFWMEPDKPSKIDMRLFT